MATSLGYDDAGRSKLDRILKGKTVKIDAALLDDLKAYLKNQGVTFLEPAVTEESAGYALQDVSLEYCRFEVTRQNGRYVAERMEKGRYHVDPAEVSHADVDREELFVIPVIGDSMDPEFRSGDRLIIQPVSTPDHQLIPSDGVYLYRLEESIQVKRLMRQPKRTVKVVSANEKYETYDFVVDDDDLDIEIIGRVWARLKRY
ncbi:S24 family peptidase [Longibacter sp.]|jgi:phage repressor protein C with HTH and peptisase S24 domain|uniref:S24 family peptidase n=1 Tax=Longibacter sp. TaxID=2045415 RepID=UPI003EBE3870